MNAPKRPAKKARKRPSAARTRPKVPIAAKPAEAEPAPDLKEGEGAADVRSQRRAKGEAAPVPQEMYRLELTQRQRNAMVRYANVDNSLRHRLESAETGVQRVELTRAELEHLKGQLIETDPRAAGPDRKQLFEVLGKIVVSLARGPRRTRSRAPAKAPSEGRSVYQFKISLKDVSPPIWRRIQVHDCDLGRFHHYIQAIFDWWDYHLHQFEINGEHYSPLSPEELELDFGEDHLDESEARLSDLIVGPRRKHRWLYEYDFGDGWRHEIVFEKLVPADPKTKYPLCLEGARAGPPEDCGGPWGYAEFCEAIANPQHEQHKELLRWRGPFDPEAFDPVKATKAMRKAR